MRDSPRPVGVADVAESLQLHRNTVRFHLDRLEASGQVERVGTTSGSVGRPALVYRAVPVMDPDGPRQFRLLAHVLVAALARVPDARAKAEAAGREWGRRLTAPPVAGRRGVRRSVLELLALMRELGFEPDLEPARHQVGLRNCPFLELVEEPPGLVCHVHLGIVQGALEAWQAPITVERLDTLVMPDRCVAHLSRAPAA